MFSQGFLVDWQSFHLTRGPSIELSMRPLEVQYRPKSRPQNQKNNGFLPLFGQQAVNLTAGVPRISELGEPQNGPGLRAKNHKVT